MVCLYRFNDNCAYIPIHLNLIIHYGNKDVGETNNNHLIFDPEKNESSLFYKAHVNKDFISDISKKINDYTSEYFILDFDKIERADDCGTFSSLGTLIQTENIQIIFINLNKELIKQIESSDCCGEVVHAGDVLCSKGKAKCYYYELVKKNGDLAGQALQVKRNLIIEYLKGQIDPKDTTTTLVSSNIYSNMYFDVKKLFKQYKIYCLAIYELCDILVKKFDLGKFQTHKFDYLICVSKNGVGLTTIIGQVLNKEVLYLISLGPSIKIKERSSIEKIKEGKKYLLVFDFICLGNEFKLAKSVLEFKKAELVGAVGVSKYLEPYRFEESKKGNIYTLFDVNDENTNLGYQVFAEKGEKNESAK